MAIMDEQAVRLANKPPMRTWLAPLIHAVCRSLLYALAASFVLPATARASPAATNAYRLLLVPSAETTVYSEFTETVKRRLAQSTTHQVSITSYTPVELAATVDRTGRFPDVDLIVPIGTQAAQAVSGYSSDRPVLFALLPRTTYRAILRRFQENFPPDRPHSALFVDQPLRRHLLLTRAILPNARHIGVLLGPATRQLRRPLIRLARKMGLKPEIEQINDGSKLYAKLNALLRRSDVIMSLPDPTVYNSRTVRGILMTTYRQRTPLIGYSRSFAKAGALAAVYSTPQQLGRQLAAILQAVMANPRRRLPPPQSPAQFSIAVNYWVAQALGIAAPSEAELHRRVTQEDN